MDSSFTREQEELREQARAFLAERASTSWSEIAALGWTGVSVAEAEAAPGSASSRRRCSSRSSAGRSIRSLLVDGRPGPARTPAGFAGGGGGGGGSLDARSGTTRSRPRHRRARRGRRRRRTVRAGGRRARAHAHADDTRPLGVVVGGEPGRRLADADVLPALRRRAGAALALEACGVARRALEYAVEHASTREQFGRGSASIRRSRIRSATTYGELELARSLALWAAGASRSTTSKRLSRPQRRSAVRRGGGGRLRAGDPGARGDRLHLGARSPSPLQARARNPVVGCLTRRAAGRGRAISSKEPAISSRRVRCRA